MRGDHILHIVKGKRAGLRLREPGLFKGRSPEPPEDEAAMYREEVAGEIPEGRYSQAFDVDLLSSKCLLDIPAQVVKQAAVYTSLEFWGRYEQGTDIRGP